jgi:hypothetical protein
VAYSRIIFYIREGKKMIKNALSAVKSITELGVGLLALAIVASLLVGPANMSFLGDVTGNIIDLVAQLGSAGLAGLISLGIVLYILR